MHGYRHTLGRPGLQPFLWTQFLGAFNDNLFKIVVSMLAVHAAGGAHAGRQLSLVGVVFILPFLLFSGYAGQLADVYSKRRVLVVTKSLEVMAAGLGLIAFVSGRLELTYAVLFLIAVQATFFSPAKYGILPEILPDRDLSRANGILEMSTFVAIVAGTAAGGFLFDTLRDRLWAIGVIVVVVAIAGTALSLRIPHVPAAAPAARLARNPFGEIAAGVSRLRESRVLWLTVAGLSYFWFLGALLQLVMILFGTEVMGLSDTWTGILTTFAAIGIAAGSLAAGRLSGDKVELGLAPIGSIGMGLFAILLAKSTASFALAAFNLTMVGFFGGLFAVPLNALLQQKSGATEKGRLMATNNFLNMAAIVGASAALWLARDIAGLTADRIVLVFGVLTLAASVYVLTVVPEFLLRFCLWLLTHTIYRIRIVGQEHVPSRGPALLVCNHLSHVDGALVGACIQRFVRFLVYKPYYEHWAVNPLLRMLHAIPVAGGRDAVGAIEAARRELRNGHVVCIFAEGAISRTGNLLPFKRGLERIVDGLDVPIVPVYLDRVWGSVFSFKGGRFLWKWPARLPYPVTVAFGPPLPPATPAAEVRVALMTVGAQATSLRRRSRETLGRAFIASAKRRWGAFCMADSATRELTYGRALTAALLLSRWLRRTREAEPNVGVLLPASVGGALTNIAIAIAGKTSVNLNFTAGPAAMSAAIERCGIRTIVTSRTFLARADLAPMAGMVFLEDVIAGVPAFRKAAVFAAARVLPPALLSRIYSRDGDSGALATIVFSSGSTGMPKGVMLSHANILANTDAVAQVFQLREDDVIVGVLPFFHSFGFSITLWLPMVQGFGAAYHPNPMDGKAVGEIAAKHRGTILVSTPTFYASYVRKCRPEQFAHVRYALAGAEKLREPIAAAFKERFGITLLEGYGCTEMSPVVAVNAPDVHDDGQHQRATRAGTVGHPLPGVVAKVVDLETGEGPLIGRDGLLLVAGPNRMQGYIGEAERTAEAIRDGWYATGDIACMDEDGFIRITDRVSRFSKIAGEMVPHMKLEEQIQALLDPQFACAVTAVSDDARGERLVAFFTDPALAAAELWERLCRSELPRLWIPKREDLRFIDAIPTLGSGKVDLRAVRQLAAGAGEAVA
ncbi:MAG TPA: acyl-[ACP]--phospholipid O-acyltransferase [Vicinamibacterales bacterium]|nr:acyl-[ACP]--phospholipid O-acyltransferase [Vicinamibacterales bacterium]